MTVNLLDYFRYLRDVSQKISVVNDWGKCLKQKPTKGLEPITQITINELEKDFSMNVENKYFKNIDKYIKNFDDKEVYLGLFAIYGSKNKQMLGSLFNIPIKVNDNNEDLAFDVENIRVNYQILISLIEFINYEDLFATLNPIIEDISNLFIEINRYKKQVDINKALENINIKLKDFLSVNKIQFKISNTTLLEKNKEIKNEICLDSNHLYIFAFQIPNEISTWKYLNDFCNEIKSSSAIKSPVLNNILSDNIIPKSNDSIEIDFDNIPILLSSKQKESIRTAFTERVSYIQGPPGTGKSHTITAIALIALLKGKKVLIVSQKNTALNVVKQKIDSYLKVLHEKSLNPYIYFEKQNKRSLKESLEKFIEQHKRNDVEYINQLLIKFSILEEEFNKCKEEKKANEKLLNFELDKQYSFLYDNENFVKEKSKINKQINYFKGITLPALSTKNEKFISFIREIEKIYKETKQISRLNKIKIRKMNDLFNKEFKTNIDFLDLLKSDILYQHVEKILGLSSKLFQVNTMYAKLANKNKLDLLVKEKESIAETFKELQKNFFNISVEYSILSKFYDYNKTTNKNTNEFENFTRMLHFQKAEIINEKFNAINFNNIFNVFNLWLCEIRHMGEILPNQAEMFDLIIVDESSQVNIAEIFPIFYRGKNICVVGDEQQLGLNSVGLNFMIGTSEEQQIWYKYLGKDLSYKEAEERNYIVTKSSILDLITSKISDNVYSKVMLDEHFRSMPNLANYTNNTYYNGDLKIMSSTPEKKLVNCFQAINVDGVKYGKINIVEAEKTIEIIKFIHKVGNYKIFSKNDFENDKSIGIVSLLRDQVEYIKSLIYSDKELNIIENDDGYMLNNCRVKCGTPEELQGDEFDYVIFSATVDTNTRNGAHYSNEKRFNVATSRARYFTYFVYSDVFRTELFRIYLKNFGLEDTTSISYSELLDWKFTESEIDSEFERYVGEYLKEFIEKNGKYNLKIFNQVPFANKKIDFVLFNELNKKHIAIEVDGHFHFKNNTGRIYSEEHNERIDLLSRAGWKIINTPYFLWYFNGKIDEKNHNLQEEKVRIEKEILQYLQIE